jgi:hypothetical protein
LFQGRVRPVDVLLIGAVGLIFEVVAVGGEVLSLVLFGLLVVDGLISLVGK